MAGQMIYIFICFVLLLDLELVFSNFHHQPVDTHKLSPGWQEPGLWRPRWIMDRTFLEKNGNTTTTFKDRLYFRLKPDKTMKVYKSQDRPLFQMFKAPPQEKKQKKKLFETGDEEVLTMEQQIKKMKKMEETLEDVDGAWWWQAALNHAVVKLETTEKAEKIRHDGSFSWGKSDQYAALFRRGKILKYKMTPQGVPYGDYEVGHFSIRVTTHRPMVSKDFLAFQ